MGKQGYDYQRDEPPMQHADVAPARAPDGGGSAPSARQVDRMLVSAPGFDLGDREVGAQFHQAFLVSNLGPVEADIRVAVSGDPSIRLRDAPAQIRRTGEGNMAPIELQYEPKSAGHKTAVVSVEGTWTTLGKHEKLEIPVRGAAHIDGQPLLADQEAAAEATANHVAQADHDAKIADQKAAKVEAFEATDVHVKADDLMKFERARDAAENALRALGHQRRAGANAARGDANTYVHQPLDPTLVDQLAERAVVMAGKKLGGTIGKAVPFVGGPIGKQAGARLAQGLVNITKADGKGPNVAMEVLGAAGWLPAQNDFFERQETMLADLEQREAIASVQDVFYLLQTELQKNPGGTIRAMNDVAELIGAGSKEAAATQAIASAAHWIDYIAQSSVGAVAGATSATPGHESTRGQSTMNLDHANQRADTAHAPSIFGGLVDVLFDGSLNDAMEPIHIRTVRLHGVSKAVIDRLAGQTLASLPIPVRAIGLLQGISAGVTVVRDEAGNVAYTDGTAEEFQHPNWLGRHIGELHKSETNQLRGAQRVMDEVTTKSFASVKIDNDSKA